MGEVLPPMDILKNMMLWYHSGIQQAGARELDVPVIQSCPTG